jgi:hypothetical protein
MITYLGYLMFLAVFICVFKCKIEAIILCIGLFSLYEICTMKGKK